MFRIMDAGVGASVAVTTDGNGASRINGGTATLTVRRESEPSAEVLAQWDRLVATRGGTDVTQLSAWATIRREVGYTPMYLF
ncbi:MAG TPA: hypothetical protein VGH99_20245, partial [Pseudonocardia sp.]